MTGQQEDSQEVEYQEEEEDTLEEEEAHLEPDCLEEDGGCHQLGYHNHNMASW